MAAVIIAPGGARLYLIHSNARGISSALRAIAHTNPSRRPPTERCSDIARAFDTCPQGGSQ